MDNPILLLVLFLAIVVMAGYYYWQRAKARSNVSGDGDVRGSADQTD